MENRDNNKRNVRRKSELEEEEIRDTAPNPELEEQEEQIRRELQTLLLFPTTPSESSSSSNQSSSSSNVVEPPVSAADTAVIPDDDRPTKIHSMKHLLQNNIPSISGDVQCGSCHGTFEISYDLQEKVAELRSFMKAHRSTMHSRSPKEWNFPDPLTCILCGKEKRVKPVIGSPREHNINWLFLLLGQLIGFCTLDEMRYFCSYNGLHKTAAKDRFVYYTYVKLFMMISRDR
ncbi:hypothetical protein PIB30_071586 [Stylosanthes scabra]|uniref:DUF7086 domain-containing protein n=1 Tax=Stylosanthes scabra TaxID=79078 RepID=A0ABU6XPM6_9FABA|nr:hypothetical protein [Stylosanthes scabra]